MDDRSSWFITLGRLAATGIEVVACVLVCLFIGSKLDGYFSTSPIFILLFSLFGLGGMVKIIFYNVGQSSNKGEEDKQ